MYRVRDPAYQNLWNDVGRSGFLKATTSRGVSGISNFFTPSQLRGETLVTTTIALVAFVNRWAGTKKPTIAAESASIVATHSNLIPP